MMPRTHGNYTQALVRLPLVYNTQVTRIVYFLLLHSNESIYSVCFSPCGILRQCVAK